MRMNLSSSYGEAIVPGVKTEEIEWWVGALRRAKYLRIEEIEKREPLTHYWGLD